MKTLSIKNDKIVIHVSKTELWILSNALTEVCKIVEEWEFESLISVKIQEAREILNKTVHYLAIKAGNDNEIQFEISTDELIVFTNTLGVLCYALKILEFDKRIGTSIENAKAMLDTLNSIYAKTKKTENWIETEN